MEPFALILMLLTILFGVAILSYMYCLRAMIKDQSAILSKIGNVRVEREEREDDVLRKRIEMIRRMEEEASLRSATYQ
ncbi:hypothetical protein IWZ03DRAFT_168178 [Phyllosticta citriasiana]|uniref:Uncharacterized protein n=1 Tax=Phyllosticta citriasiana TaxID=595635 RepID=A0ABR1KSS7_9PEZI